MEDISTYTECNYQLVHRRDGLNPPEPVVTTLGVIHKANCYRADSICPYGKMIAILCLDTLPSDGKKYKNKDNNE